MNLWPEMSRQRWIFLLLLSFGVMAVVSGYTSLSETDDELFHLACGMQWWRDGTYTMQPLHPPLARVMDASLVYLRELLFGPYPVGPKFKSDVYMSRMVLSRLGSLPYYILSCTLVFLWARKLFGEGAAVWSLGVYVTLSTVSAHAMLATTDMGYTAMFLWALYMSVLWLEDPSRRRSAWLGVSLAMMVGTKFSGLLHWPLAFLGLLLLQLAGNWRAGRWISPLGKGHFLHGALVTAPVFAFVLWAVYRFDFGPLVAGIRSAVRLDHTGFGVWFYRPLNNTSVWYFFPVVFFFKTPLAFFASTAVGAALAAGRWLRGAGNAGMLFPLVAAVLLLVSSMTSHINLGVRHVLPLYPLLAIPAGYGLWRLWQGGAWGRGAAVVLALWQFVGFCMYQPEHIAYFNFLAGEEPERITLDSDYDWGQSMIMLNEELEKRGIREVYLCARRDAVWGAQFVVRARARMCPSQPVSGWIAIARAWRLLHPDNFTWLTHYEGVEKIGKTMDLYYIAPDKDAKATPAVVPPQGKAAAPFSLPHEFEALLPKTSTPVPFEKPSLTMPPDTP